MLKLDENQANGELGEEPIWGSQNSKKRMIIE